MIFRKIPEEITGGTQAGIPRESMETSLKKFMQKSLKEYEWKHLYESMKSS